MFMRAFICLLALMVMFDAGQAGSCPACALRPADYGAVDWKAVKIPCGERPRSLDSGIQVYGVMWCGCSTRVRPCTHAGALQQHRSSFCKGCVCALLRVVTSSMVRGNVTYRGQPANDPLVRSLLMRQCFVSMAGPMTGPSQGNLTLDEVMYVIQRCPNPAEVVGQCPFYPHAAQSFAMSRMRSRVWW